MSYVEQLRDLTGQYSLEPDPIKRQRIIERVLFLIESRSSQRAHLESKGPDLPAHLRSISLLDDYRRPAKQGS